MLQRHEVPVELPCICTGCIPAVRLGWPPTSCNRMSCELQQPDPVPSWAHQQATRHCRACRRRTPYIYATDSFAAGIWARRMVRRGGQEPRANIGCQLCLQQDAVRRCGAGTCNLVRCVTMPMGQTDACWVAW